MKKVILAGAVAGMLGLSAPVARAAAVTGDCGFNTFAQETATGGQDTFTGVAYGYAVSDTPGASISVHCEVRVNGGPASTTPPGPAGQGSATVGQVTYTAAETDVVTLCAVWTGSESGERCGDTTSQQIPPQEIVDLLSQGPDIDWLVCPIYASLAGTYAVDAGPFGKIVILYIAPDGDIYPAGFPRTWNCPPY